MICRITPMLDLKAVQLLTCLPSILVFLGIICHTTSLVWRRPTISLPLIGPAKGPLGSRTPLRRPSREDQKRWTSTLCLWGETISHFGWVQHPGCCRRSNIPGVDEGSCVEVDVSSSRTRCTSLLMRNQSSYHCHHCLFNNHDRCYMAKSCSKRALNGALVTVHSQFWPSDILVHAPLSGIST